MEAGGEGERRGKSNDQKWRDPAWPFIVVHCCSGD